MLRRDERARFAPMTSTSTFRSALAAALSLLAAATHAGPPFVTDDPDPVDDGHWEINSAATGVHAANGTTVFAPQVDANYGAARGVQLHLQPQMAYSVPAGAPAGPSAYGVGDLEIGVKFRVVDWTGADGEWMLSAYPLYEAPTGSARRGLGEGASSGFVPVWLQWSGGRWTSFGGGGYWIESGPGRRNSWASGWAALYQFTPALQLGGEVFARTADSVGAHGTAGFNLGGTYALNPDCALLFSAGRGIVNVASTDEAAWYLGIRITR